jgi:DNA-binding NarL/FixJ family response regulator
MSRPQHVVIFLVDPDLNFTDKLSGKLCTNDSATVHQFSDGDACMKHIHHHPDIIIMDMGPSSGNSDEYEALETLKAIHKTSTNATVILLSDHASYGMAGKAIALGATHFLLKDENVSEKLCGLVDEICLEL